MEAPGPPPPRSLDVWIDRRKVGQLREQGNIWALRYTSQWQAQGFDLSPALPRAGGEIIDGASLRPVQWFFDNLLPEEGARRLLARSGVREVESSDICAFCDRRFFSHRRDHGVTGRQAGVAWLL